MLVLAVVSVVGRAHAQDLEATPGEVVTLAPGAGQVVRVEWARGEGDVVLPELVISGNRRAEVNVALTFRASFADRLTSWRAEPVWVEAETSVLVPVTIPTEVQWADEQDNFLTDLEITVQSYDSDERLVGTHGGPRLKLLWSDTEFTLLDPAQARALAPYGFAREAPPGAEEILEEEAAQGNFNVEFGPGI